MIWLLLVLAAFATGAAAASRWTVVVWPAVSIGLGVYVVANEQANYDMHGFGYYLGALTGLACGAAWLGGRLLRRGAPKR